MCGKQITTLKCALAFVTIGVFCGIIVNVCIFGIGGKYIYHEQSVGDTYDGYIVERCNANH